METAIKEEIASFRSDSNNLFVFFMAVLTGAAAILFKVVTKEISAWFGAVSIIGFVLAVFTLLWMLKIRRNIDDLIDELREIK